MVDIEGVLWDLVDAAMDAGMTFSEIESHIHGALEAMAEELVSE